MKNNDLLSFKLFEFAVEWTPAIINKAEIIINSKSHLHYCNCWKENKKCISCILGTVLPTSVWCSKKVVSSVWLFFLLESKTKEIKSLPTIICKLAKRFFKDTLCSIFEVKFTLKRHFLEKHRFYQKSRNDAYSRGWVGGHNIWVIMTYCVQKSICDRHLTPREMSYWRPENVLKTSLYGVIRIRNVHSKSGWRCRRRE